MRTKSRIKLALTFAASQFHSRTTETCLFDAITSLFPLRNNMSTTTKLLKNSRWFELSNRKAPGACPEAGVQATFGSNIRSLEHRGSRLPPPGARANGGGERDRTDDPLLAKQVLSQLSYTPVNPLHHHFRRPVGSRRGMNWWVWMDSNHRPPPYQDGALTS